MDWREVHEGLLQDQNRREAYEKVDLGFEVGKMIADGRIARKMTQEKLAEVIGTKQPSIARVEKGNYLPSFAFLQKIAKALNTQLLPPRLELLEGANNTITVPPKATIFFSHLATPEIDYWELCPGDTSCQQWPGTRKITTKVKERTQYATS